MPSAADAAIQSLRAVHDELAARVAGYADADLARPSGAAEWTVAQVLSHIGSGAEIALAGLEAARAGSPPPEQSFYQSVWDRWNAMTPRQQADGGVSADAALVDGYEALDDTTRQTLRLELPFLPEPVGLDLQAALRLNESTLHGWDVAVSDGTAATLNPTAVPLLATALTGPRRSAGSLPWLLTATTGPAAALPGLHACRPAAARASLAFGRTACRTRQPRLSGCDRGWPSPPRHPPPPVALLRR